MVNVNVKLLFLDKSDFAYFNQNTINICINEKHEIKTKLLMFFSLLTHEITHVNRFNSNKFKPIYIQPKTSYEYFLDPEEMLAFYNQILIESIIRKTSFTKCVRYFIKNYLENTIVTENITKRFYNGLHTLHAKNAERFIDMNADSVRSLEQFDNDMNIWMGSIARAAMGVPPEQREEFVAEKRRQLELMRLDIINQLEEYEAKQKTNQ